MKNLPNFKIKWMITPVICVGFLFSCKQGDKNSSQDNTSIIETANKSSFNFTDQGNLVEVKSSAMDFQVSD